MRKNRAFEVYYGSALFFTLGIFTYGGLYYPDSVFSLLCHFDIFSKVLMIVHIHIQIQRALSSFKLTALAPNQGKYVRVKVNIVSIFLCQTIERI